MLRFALLALVLVGLTGMTPTPSRTVSPKEVAGATTVDVARVKVLFDQGVQFVDVRTHADWEAGRVPGAKHIELKTEFTEKALAKVAAKDKEIVFYCNGETCLRSSEACTQAVAWGFRRVYYFRDGFPAWKIAGYPVE